MTTPQQTKTAQASQNRDHVPTEYQHHAYKLDVRSLTRGQLLDSYSELKRQNDKAIELLRNVPAWFSEWNVECGPAEESLLQPIQELLNTIQEDAQ